MGSGNTERIQSVYGINWAAVDERARGLEASSGLFAPDLRARISPEVDERTLHGLEGFAVFVLGLEEDFSEFRYEADEFQEPLPDRVLVIGHIRARGRASKMLLSAPFGHLWTLRDGRAVDIEAHLRPDDAVATARRVREAETSG